MTRRFLIFTAFLTTSLSAAELTVASFNIRFASRGDLGMRAWENRKELTVETIRNIDPDVFGVQEALDHQMEFLKKNLPGYETYGVGRDDGEKKGEYSAIFLRKERLERDPKEAGTYWLSPTPDQAGTNGWGNEVIRICTWTRLVDKKTGKGFYLYNTHWDHQNQPSRERAARLMAKRADARSHPGEPVIFTGDFNATETNPGIAYLLGTKVKLAGSDDLEEWSHPLRSTFLTLHPDEENRRTFNSWRGDRDGKWTIDHVLVSPEWTVKKAWIDYQHKGEMWPSDHYPVAAVLELQEEKPKE